MEGKNMENTNNNLVEYEYKELNGHKKFNEYKELIEFFDLNQTQALFIAKKCLGFCSVEELINYYFTISEKENIVGTSFEKLNIALRRFEIEQKERFNDKEIFLTWLYKNYKGKAFMRLKDGEFSYKVLRTYKDVFDYRVEKVNLQDEKLVIEKESREAILYMSLDKKIMIDYDIKPSYEYLEALIDYIFKNQDRIGKDLDCLIDEKKEKEYLSYKQALIHFEENRTRKI